MDLQELSAQVGAMPDFPLSEATMLPRSFYARDPVTVARALLGKYLVRRLGTEVLAGRIVEVEAYLHEGDAASHRQRGLTERTRSLFGDPGHAYVHSQRHHTLMDIVTQNGSVLLRALEPVAGIETMMTTRGTNVLKNIASGPGKLCQALQIARAMDGADLLLPRLFVAQIELDAATADIEISPRVGLGRAQELLLRFSIKGNPYVSKA